MKDLVLENCRLDGRYDVSERLGRGSYAEIFLAEDVAAAPHTVHKRVVIKALNVFLQNDLDHDLERTLVENFQNEAVSLDAVRHPNIISRLGHGTAKDLRGTLFHYLVLEYLPGGDLAAYCRDNDLTVDKALSFLEQACAGLAHAHSKGIIHRDIKPQNLLLTADDKIVKIADFGVARATSAENPITRVGTNVYAPPEHSPLTAGLTGRLYSEITPAADIYSLAKTTYVLFTGETPRYSANRPITELPHEFRVQPWAEGLLAALSKATLDDPAERYQEVTDFWRELAKLADIRQPLPAGTAENVITAVGGRKSTTPQAHVAKGFSPLAPVKPSFDTSKNLKFNAVAPTTRLKPPVGSREYMSPPIQSAASVGQPPPGPLQQPVAPPPAVEPEKTPAKPKKKRRLLKALGTLAILLAVFSFSLIATYNYLLGNPIFGNSGTTVERRGVATTDINLRPSPTTSNTPVGIVTRNSKLRILRTSNNWHEVVIIQHGRPKVDPASPEKGWVYGRYVREEQ